MSAALNHTELSAVQSLDYTGAGASYWLGLVVIWQLNNFREIISSFKLLFRCSTEDETEGAE